LHESQELAQRGTIRQRNSWGRSLGYKRHAWRLGVMPALDPLRSAPGES
jgi:hypothetical protein